MLIIIRLGACALLLVGLLSNLAGQTRRRLGTDTEAPPQRLALLVGNSKYQNLNPLKNPKNDVDKLAAKLEELGFEKPTVVYDLNHDDFVATLEKFKLRIAPGDMLSFTILDMGSNWEGRIT